MPERSLLQRLWNFFMFKSLVTASVQKGSLMDEKNGETLEKEVTNDGLGADKQAHKQSEHTVIIKEE